MMLLLLVRLLLLVFMLVAMMLWSLLCPLWPQLLMMRAS
jgi:hypothetical protein